MTDYNESADNMVEVDLILDCSCSVPSVGEDGTIEFVKAYPGGDSFLSLNKVKVPKEAVVSQKTLSGYICYKQQEWSEEFVSLTNPNIWDKDDQDERGGAFRFS